MSEFAPAAPICLLSAHLDDAVLSCAHFLKANPGVTVVTVCAGSPEGAAGNWNGSTTHARDARTARDVRRCEDVCALDTLGAGALHLDHWDGEYLADQQTEPRDTSGMLEDIRGVAEELRAGSIVFPLGLSHWDHQAVSNACLDLASQMNAEFYAYLDMPYAQTDPAHLLRRMPHVVARVGLLPEPTPYYARDPMVKRNAFLHYSSQFVPVSDALSFEASIGDAEQYWPISGAIGP